MRRSLPLLVALLLVLSGSAHAEDKDRARELFRQATQHYDLGEYQQALDGFKEAYRNYEDPAFLFNIAQCHRQLGDNEQAVRDYRMYLIKVPDAPNGADVRALVTKLEKAISDERANKSLPPAGTAPVSANAGAAGLTRLVVTAPPRRPLYKKWWLWTAVGAGAVAIAIGLGVGLSHPSAPSASTSFGTVPF